MNWAGAGVIAGLLAIAFTGPVPAIVVGLVVAFVWKKS
jgi:hypothetical protein